MSGHKEAIPVTHLRNLMLEELERRNYSQNTGNRDRPDADADCHREHSRDPVRQSDPDLADPLPLRCTRWRSIFLTCHCLHRGSAD
ncbi:MAG: hypothetical protein DMG59_11065 [Acidobacteria bacterium]|nr:MAG: hypothetical protein DMG59_11065 [Acidobacteriota bacterium]